MPALHPNRYPSGPAGVRDPVGLPPCLPDRLPLAIRPPKPRRQARIRPRPQAYVTVPGLPHDLLLRGDGAQNRAVEGDEVAVAVLPMASWYTVHKLAATGGPPSAASNVRPRE
jgi:hypothetical protein